MVRDYLGNPLTGQRDSTLRGIDDFIEGYLGYETRAERIPHIRLGRFIRYRRTAIEAWILAMEEARVTPAGVPRAG